MQCFTSLPNEINLNFLKAKFEQPQHDRIETDLLRLNLTLPRSFLALFKLPIFGASSIHTKFELVTFKHFAFELVTFKPLLPRQRRPF